MSERAADAAGHWLVLGGARSGKSRYGEALALRYSERPWYVATAEPGDGEMQERIALHRGRRGAQWRTREEPLALPALLAGFPAGDTVLVDCLTVWLGNLMVHGHDPEPAGAELLAVLAETQARLILVANEVGLAPLPDNAMARDFARHAGRLNQSLASEVDRVMLLLAGCPLRLKPAGP